VRRQRARPALTKNLGSTTPQSTADRMYVPISTAKGLDLARAGGLADVRFIIVRSFSSPPLSKDGRFTRSEFPERSQAHGEHPAAKRQPASVSGLIVCSPPAPR